MNFTASYLEGLFVAFLPVSVLIVVGIVKKAKEIAEIRRIMSLDRRVPGVYWGSSYKFGSRFSYEVGGRSYGLIVQTRLFLPKTHGYTVYYDPADPNKACVGKISVRGCIADIILFSLVLTVIFFIPIVYKIVS